MFAVVAIQFRFSSEKCSAGEARMWNWWWLSDRYFEIAGFVARMGVMVVLQRFCR